MNPKLLVLPTLCLGGAAFLLAPARDTLAFTKTSRTLSEGLRHVRLFDNFADPAANDNTTADTQFPGFTGAELAVWKGVVEWGSRLHGDGSGDPLGGNTLGSGNANFDGFWAGNATAIGGTTQNVMSAIATCDPGVVAFAETPLVGGFRIRFCDSQSWDDGPGAVSGHDLQSIAAHMYGRALGLGSSSVDGATMYSTTVTGHTHKRSLHADDIAGIRCLYGFASVTKPIIVETEADPSAGTLTIRGSQFGATDNEVWFCRSAATTPVTDPIVRVTGVAAVPTPTGDAEITVAIPAAAGPGDVIVKIAGAGNATVSNAFPTDLVGRFGPPRPYLASVTPSTIDALIPGTAETITLTGTDLDSATEVSIDQVAVDPSRWTIVSSSTITLDMPQVETLGAHVLGVANAFGRVEVGVTVVACSTPTLEWGNGEPGNGVVRGDGLDFVVAGPVGETHLVLSSNLGPPALGAFFGLASRFDDGPELVAPGSYEIPSSGWLAVHIPTLPDPSLAGSTWHARSFAIVRPGPFASSNTQSITLVP